MNLSQLIDEFLAKYNFDQELNKQIKNDLIKIINAKIIIEINKNNNEISTKLNQAIEEINYTKIQEIIQKFANNKNWSSRFNVIINQTLTDWQKSVVK